jgi:hypothetical protein
MRTTYRTSGERKQLETAVVYNTATQSNGDRRSSGYIYIYMAIQAAAVAAAAMSVRKGTGGGGEEGGLTLFSWVARKLPPALL